MTGVLGQRRNRSGLRDCRNNAQIGARGPLPHFNYAGLFEELTTSYATAIYESATMPKAVVGARAKKVAGRPDWLPPVLTEDGLKGISNAEFAGCLTAGTTTRGSDRSLQHRRFGPVEGCTRRRTGIE